MVLGIYWVLTHTTQGAILRSLFLTCSVAINYLLPKLSEQQGSENKKGHMIFFILTAYLQGLERPKEPGLSSLRTARKLLEGMVSADSTN